MVDKRNKSEHNKKLLFIINTLLNEYIMIVRHRQLALHQNHALHYYCQHVHPSIVSCENTCINLYIPCSLLYMSIGL